MFCEKCGKPMPKESSFCEFCGHNIKERIKIRENEIQQPKLEKTLKNSIIASALIISLSIAYYLILKPIQKQSAIKKCNKNIEKLVGWNSSGGYSDKTEKFKKEFDRCLREKGL
jgi:uncharacterized membrane protein YvbJ